jgi:hypothetical protein
MNLRIGIPNVLPLFGFLLFGTFSILLTISFLDKVDAETTGASIFFVIFILSCYAMFSLLCYRFKVIIMTESKLVIVLPFRFQFRVFKFESIQDLKWDLWGIHRLGDYRKLNILTSSGYRTNISDLEFINYDSLEKRLIDKTDVKLNLHRKMNVELQQAKWNKWLNLVVIVMFVLFFFLLSNGRMRTDIRFGIQIAIVIITWRLVARLVQYQQRINRSKQRK